jgi:hypothetical protein
VGRGLLFTVDMNEAQVDRTPFHVDDHAQLPRIFSGSGSMMRKLITLSIEDWARVVSL